MVALEYLAPPERLSHLIENEIENTDRVTTGQAPFATPLGSARSL